MAEDNLPDEKQETPLDKIKSHLLDDTELPDRQKPMLERYRRAMAYMCHEDELNSPGNCIKFIQGQYELSYPQAAKVVRDAIALWGDVFKYSHVGLKQLHYERMLRIGEEARQAGNFKIALRAEEKAAEIWNLFNPNQSEENLNQLFQINIYRTTDSEVLKNENKTVDISPNNDN